MKDFDGVTGKLSFDKNHDVVRAGTAGVYLLEVKDGKYVKVQVRGFRCLYVVRK